MRTPKNKPTWPDNLESFIDDLNAESKSGTERGAVLLCAAMLDEILRLLVGAFLIEGERSDSLFDVNSPFGFFSDRIKVAYALGLITEGERTKLDMIRDIRNDAAHLTSFSLETREHASRCRQLIKGCVPDELLKKGVYSGKGQLITASMFLITHIGTRVPGVAEARRKVLEL